MRGRGDGAAHEGDDRSPSGEDQNFEFAFNSSNFSDRVLRIEIAGAPPESSESDGGSDVSDGKRRRKRRREHEKNDGPLHRSNPSPVFSTKSIHINSAILAAISPFFYKFFSNGMQESDQRQATLRIDHSEEAALMELLGFMYSGKLTTTSAPLLFSVLIAADKFEVPSCLKRCSEILCKLPIDSETAPLFLELPSSVSMAAKLDSKATSAAEFFTKKYVNLTEYQEEVMSLPLAAIEAILSSNKLQVNSEDKVYNFVLKWAFAQYPVPKERKEVLCSRLLRLVRFEFMTCSKLREALRFEVLGCRVASDAVFKALFFKCGANELKEVSERRILEAQAAENAEKSRAAETEAMRNEIAKEGFCQGFQLATFGFWKSYGIFVDEDPDDFIALWKASGSKFLKVQKDRKNSRSKGAAGPS